jgi:cytochrome P450
MWTYRDFPEMTQLITAVLNRYPPIISVFRSARQDCSIEIAGKQFRIKKGTLLYIPLAQYLSELPPAPAAPHPFKTTIFSKGARMCPGAHLALRTLLTYFALILKYGLRFAIHSENGHEAHLAYKPYELRLRVYHS